jgi:hypothetical protein
MMGERVQMAAAQKPGGRQPSRIIYEFAPCQRRGAGDFSEALGMAAREVVYSAFGQATPGVAYSAPVNFARYIHHAKPP